MKKLVGFLCALLMVVSLTACGGGNTMPMEVTVDGFTIVLGKTSVAELIERGYVASLTKTPDTAKKGDKYIPFHLSLDRGAGDQIFVTVYVPWGGKSDVSVEKYVALEKGVIQSVSLRKSATTKVEVLYDGTNLQDITFESAATQWGAKKKDKTYKLTYSVATNVGLFQLESFSDMETEVYEMILQISLGEFEKLQKT